MTLSEKIVAARKAQGLTQEELAERAGVTVRTIQRAESGGSLPRDYTLKAIATALQIPFSDFTALPPAAAPALPVIYPADEAAAIHFLQTLCLSCFSYIVLPFVHFLVPAYLLKKKVDLAPGALLFARSVIRQQIGWAVALHLGLLLSLGFNLVSAARYGRQHLLSYLAVFFAGYAVNAVLIGFTLLRVKRVVVRPAPAG